MHTDYKEKQKNKKALFLLLMLGVFGFIAFKFTKVKDIVAVDNNVQQTSCPDDIVDKSPSESNMVVFNLEDDGSLTDISPGVLGTDDGPGCGVGNTLYAADSACVLEGARPTLNINGKFYVSSDASIEMTSITAPLWVLTGSSNVKNSDGEIDDETQYIPPANKVVKKKLLEVNLPPGDLHDETVKNAVKDTNNKTPYSVEYEVSVNGGDAATDTMTINKYAENNCGDKCDSDASTNPRQSNESSKVLKGAFYDFPGQTEEDTSSQVLQVEGICKNVDQSMVIGVSVCKNRFKLLTGIISSLFPSSDWSQCRNSNSNDDPDDDDNGCIKAETIAVKISPMFKETNAFTGTRTKVGMDPESASNYQTVYVVTDCHANVADRDVVVKCMWDASYLFNERKAAEFDDLGESETPTVEEYKAILQKASTRSESDLQSM
jgi:hypothetical protein